MVCDDDGCFHSNKRDILPWLIILKNMKYVKDP